MRTWPLAGLIVSLLLGGNAAGAPTAAPEAIAAEAMQSYVAAWDRADARAIAAQFAPDGDFINPTGFYARGPAAVEAFYRAAFAQGSAGSVGRFELRGVQPLARDVIVVDGVWSIEGARDPDGRVRPPERGLATGVLVRGADGWRVALLREQASAHDLQMPPR